VSELYVSVAIWFETRGVAALLTMRDLILRSTAKAMRLEG